MLEQLTALTFAQDNLSGLQQLYLSCHSLSSMMSKTHNSMEFIHALLNHTPPPNKIGISYMLAGDKGASNTDPYATSKTADNPPMIVSR